MFSQITVNCTTSLEGQPSHFKLSIMYFNLTQYVSKRAKCKLYVKITNRQILGSRVIHLGLVLLVFLVLLEVLRVLVAHLVLVFRSLQADLVHLHLLEFQHYQLDLLDLDHLLDQVDPVVMRHDLVTMLVFILGLGLTVQT